MRQVKRVLIVAPLRGSGGVETHVLRLSRLLHEAGAEVTLACRIRSNDAPLHWFRHQPGFRFLTTPFSWKWPRLAMAWALHVWPLLLPHDFDVIYTLDLSRLVCALRKLLKPCGYLFANRVGEASEVSVAQPEVVAALDGFITETETQAAQYRSRVPIRVIPHLIDHQISSAPRKRDLHGRPLRVAYLGRYERPKGIFRLVDIWSQAQPEGATLAFYGIGPDRTALEQYIRTHGLSQQVTVNDGWSSSAGQSAILASVDLVMLASESEGLPLVLLEALAHGIPFIASDVGGVRELARDNPDGCVVPLDNAAFVTTLRQMLARIRRGEISSERLQSYFARRYDHAGIAAQWCTALLEPEKFWPSRVSPVPNSSTSASTRTAAQGGNPPRILIASWLQGPGGIETHLLMLSRLLVARGAQVTIAARVAKPAVPLEHAAPSIPVTLLKTPLARNPRWLRVSTAWALAAWPRHFTAPFDAILTLERGRFTRSLRKYLKPGGKVIGAYAGDLPSAADALRSRENCDALLVESAIHERAFRQFVGPDFPIAVAPLLGHYADPAPRAPFSRTVMRVAFLGRFDRPKGVHRLLDLWPQINLPAAELHYHGGGPEAAALRSQIHARNLANVFVHGGWASAADLDRILTETDLVVLPSASEGIPVVLLEAMAHGVPFVATDVGAIRVLAERNPDVAVVANHDAALAAAITQMTARIQSGDVSSLRLQRYFAAHFSFEGTASVWLRALLEAQGFWSAPQDLPQQ